MKNVLHINKLSEVRLLAPGRLVWPCGILFIHRSHFWWRNAQTAMRNRYYRKWSALI